MEAHPLSRRAYAIPVDLNIVQLKPTILKNLHNTLKNVQNLMGNLLMKVAPPFVSD